MLRFESSQQPTANSPRSSSSSSSSTLSDPSDHSDSESTNKPDSTLPVYEEYMSSSSPTSQQPSSTLTDAPEDGIKSLVQVLERLEKALNQQQQTQTAEVSSSPPPPPPPPTSGPSPSKKVKSAGSSASSQSSVKTKKQLEEVFATVRDKLHEVSELLKQ